MTRALAPLSQQVQRKALELRQKYIDSPADIARFSFENTLEKLQDAVWSLPSLMRGSPNELRQIGAASRLTRQLERVLDREVLGVGREELPIAKRAASSLEAYQFRVLESAPGLAQELGALRAKVLRRYPRAAEGAR